MIESVDHGNALVKEAPGFRIPSGNKKARSTGAGDQTNLTRCMRGYIVVVLRPDDWDRSDDEANES